MGGRVSEIPILTEKTIKIASLVKHSKIFVASFFATSTAPSSNAICRKGIVVVKKRNLIKRGNYRLSTKTQRIGISSAQIYAKRTGKRTFLGWRGRKRKPPPPKTSQNLYIFKNFSFFLSYTIYTIAYYIRDNPGLFPT